MDKAGREQANIDKQETAYQKGDQLRRQVKRKDGKETESNEERDTIDRQETAHNNRDEWRKMSERREH